jgi:hypothetical protein
LVVAAQVVHGGQGQLVLLLVLQLLVELHQLVLVARSVRDVEQQPRSERDVGAAHGLPLGLLVHLLEEVARCDEQVYFFPDIVCVEQLLVRVFGALETAQME